MMPWKKQRLISLSHKMDFVFEQILKNTYTISQFNHRLRVLKIFLNDKLFDGSKPVELAIEDQNWLKSLPSEFFNQFNANNLLDIIQSIQQKLSQSPTLILNIAFSADDQSLSQIGEFVRKNFKSFTILDIKYNPGLISGCALVWKGIYKDYSLKAGIEAKKEEVFAEFKKFLR